MRKRTIVSGACALVLAAAAIASAPSTFAQPAGPDGPPPPAASAPPPPPGEGPMGPRGRWRGEGQHAEGRGHGWGGPHLGGGHWGAMRKQRLARSLSEQETVIGIRSNQLDAWRDYTDAFLAVAAPDRRGDARPPRGEPFARAQALAERAITRGEAGEKLKAAIEKLRAVLTPEQLDRMSDASRGGGRPGMDRRPNEGPGRGPDPQDEGPGRL